MCSCYHAKSGRYFTEIITGIRLCKLKNNVNNCIYMLIPRVWIPLKSNPRVSVGMLICIKNDTLLPDYHN